MIDVGLDTRSIEKRLLEDYQIIYKNTDKLERGLFTIEEGNEECNEECNEEGNESDNSKSEPELQSMSDSSDDDVIIYRISQSNPIHLGPDYTTLSSCCPYIRTIVNTGLSYVNRN